MDKTNQSAGAATDLWQHTLSTIDTVFGRLVYLSALCDPDSGLYEHFGLTRDYGVRKTDRAMREAHRKAFSEWLCFTLRQQFLDLDAYLASLTVDRRLVLRAWERQATYLSLVPPEADEAERQLYLCDFQMIVTVMKSAGTVAESQPTFRPTVRCFP